MVFDHFWASYVVQIVLFNLTDSSQADGRPLPNQACLVDMPDDFFRVRLVCVILDTCGMCFDRGTQKKKLDNFLTMFQVNRCPEAFPIVDFVASLVLPALQTTSSNGRRVHAFRIA